MRLLRCVAALAFTVMVLGCSVIPKPNSKPIPIVTTQIIQCPLAGTVKQQCPVDDKPSPEQLRNVQVLDSYRIIGTWAQNLIKCQSEVKARRAAEQECEGLK